MRAARYLGVAPWDLLDRPACWTTWALTAEGAEEEARAALAEQARESH